MLAIALLASIMAFVGFSMALALSILLLPLIGAIRAALMHTGYEREDSLLRRTGFRICRRCFHDLSGLPQQGNCPECGAAFVMAEVEEFWSGYANHRDALHGL